MPSLHFCFSLICTFVYWMLVELTGMPSEQLVSFLSTAISLLSLCSPVCCFVQTCNNNNNDNNIITIIAKWLSSALKPQVALWLRKYFSHICFHKYLLACHLILLFVICKSALHTTWHTIVLSHTKHFTLLCTLCLVVTRVILLFIHPLLFLVSALWPFCFK